MRNMREKDKPENETTKNKIVLCWGNIIFLTILHLCIPYTLYLGFTTASYWTWIYSCVNSNLAMLGVTAGAHRLWSHRSYKAKLPMRIFLLICYSMTGEMSLYRWVRDHHLHHKYNNTNGDPYSASRGFFFAHIGWILCEEHPDATAGEKTLLLDFKDPVVVFHKKYRHPCDLFFVVILPTLVPIYLWHESPLVALLAAMTRYMITLHLIFLINSFAHMYGDRPFDKKVTGTENPICSFLTLGEAWHNFHHTFPVDYAASELGYELNVAKLFIDLMAKIGQAYDLKTVDKETVRRRMERTGDGSRNI